MTNQQTAPVNPAAEREYLIHALRTAAARSLRHKSVSTDEAMKWLHDEGILDHVQLGPPGGAS
jgi:hypothetical protein